MSDVKSFVVKILVTIVLIAGVFVGGNIFMKHRAENIKIEKQAQIHKLIELVDFPKIHDDEQEKIDKCGDDLEAVRYVIIGMVNTRVIFWRNQLDQEKQNFIKIENIKRGATIWDYDIQAIYQSSKNQITERFERDENEIKVWEQTKELAKNWQPSK